MDKKLSVDGKVVKDLYEETTKFNLTRFTKLTDASKASNELRYETFSYFLSLVSSPYYNVSIPYYNWCYKHYYQPL